MTPDFIEKKEVSEGGWGEESTRAFLSQWIGESEDMEEAIGWVKSLLLEARREGANGKDDAYHERDMLVSALSKVFPAYLARHSEEDKDWEDDWRWIVYIELPTGQVSWHIHDSERAMFDHLEVKENKWDGHNTQRKYERLNALQKLPARTAGEEDDLN